MTTFRPTLSAFQAFVLSLAIIAPTLAMAFNVPLAAQAAGRAAPLAFLVGGAAMALIGLSFVAFSRRIASAGSAASYVSAVLGDRLGFLAGWGLLLAYLAFLASATALVGGFLSVALAHLGLDHPRLWLVLAFLGGLAVIGLGGREIRIATAVMLVVEALAVLAIVVLALVILVRVPLDSAPLRPDPERGLSGLGYGMVFAVLSLAGFEGAATVAEETRDPHRAIPLAILGSLAVATLLYGLVSYAQVLGYGLDRTADLARDPAPLDTLAVRYVSRGYGIFLDAAAGISSLACALGTAAAAARVLYALAARGIGKTFARLDPAHGVPARALRFVGGLTLVSLLGFGAWTGPRAFSEAFATVATLMLILVYMAVGLAQAVLAARIKAWGWCAVGLAGSLMLAWPLFNSLYPLPGWPGPLWPIVVLAWMGVGIALLRFHPALARKSLG